jgi:hypothetical protein
MPWNSLLPSWLRLQAFPGSVFISIYGSRPWKSYLHAETFLVEIFVFGLWFYDLLIVYFVLMGLGLSISPGVSRPGHTLHLSFSFLFLGVFLDNLNVVSFFIL